MQFSPWANLHLGAVLTVRGSQSISRSTALLSPGQSDWRLLGDSVPAAAGAAHPWLAWTAVPLLGSDHAAAEAAPAVLAVPLGLPAHI